MKIKDCKCETCLKTKRWGEKSEKISCKLAPTPWKDFEQGTFIQVGVDDFCWSGLWQDARGRMWTLEDVFIHEKGGFRM